MRTRKNHASLWKLDSESHRQRHVELHQALDELAADFLAHNCPPKLLSNTTVMELVEWSHRQTVKPDDLAP